MNISSIDIKYKRSGRKENVCLLVGCLAVFMIFQMSSFSAKAQEHRISLQQSKDAAMAYSWAIKNGQLNVESAEAGISGARSAYLPSVSATGVGVYSFKDMISAMPPILPEGVNNFYFAGVNATETIYAGGKVRTANQLAAMQLDVSRIRARQSVDSVLLTTEQKYWNLVNLQEQHKTLIANEKLLNEVLKQQEDLLASGLIARNDLLKVKVQRSRLLLNKSKLQNGKKIALLDFSLYIGLPYDSLMVMADTLTTGKMPAMPSAAPDTSLNENKNFQLLQKALEGEKLQTKLTRGDYLPTVAVGVNAAKMGVVSHPLGSSFMPLSFGVVSIPISDWWGKGRSKLKQREITERLASNRLQEGQRQLKVAVMQRWYELTDALKEISFAKENLDQAEENMKVSRDNYHSGLIGVTELMDAQASLQEAQSSQTTAHANYHLKVAAYRYISGFLVP